MITIVVCTLKKDYKIKSSFPVIIVSPYKHYESGNITYLKDYGQGMAFAREIALKKCYTDYICYIGDDNIITDANILSSIKEMEFHNWSGCSLMTRSYKQETYLEKCLNLRYVKRFYPGEKKVIGTPFIFKTKILKKIGFDISVDYCDDTDLCERLRKKGYKVGTVNRICYEISERATFQEIKKRFIMYGYSDWSFYNKYSDEWNFFRKIKSLLHPLICEFIPNLYYFPFYLLIVFYRYRGWLCK